MHIGQRFEVLGDYAVRYWAQPVRRGGWVGFHQVTGPGSDGRLRQTETRHDLLAAALENAFRDGRTLIRTLQARELEQRRLAIDPAFSWSVSGAVRA